MYPHNCRSCHSASCLVASQAGSWQPDSSHQPPNQERCQSCAATPGQSCALGSHLHCLARPRLTPWLPVTCSTAYNRWRVTWRPDCSLGMLQASGRQRLMSAHGGAREKPSCIRQTTPLADFNPLLARQRTPNMLDTVATMARRCQGAGEQAHTGCNTWNFM